MLKKAQSAMEYLMTYGWAILIILIALGALFYLGVFSPNAVNNCQIAPPFTCFDVKGIEGGTTGGIGGYNVEDVFILTVGSSNANNPTVTLMSVNGVPCILGTTTQLSSSGQTSIYCRINKDLNNPFHLSKGNKFLGSITLSFSSVYGGLTHNTVGSFSGTIEGCYVTSDCPTLMSIGCGSGGNCNVVNNKCQYICSS